jgi:signal transduction histidine kinase
MRAILLIWILLHFVHQSMAQTRATDSMRRMIYQSGSTLARKQNLIRAISLQRSVNLDTLGAYLRQVYLLGPFSPAEAAAIDAGRVYYYMRQGRMDSCMAIVERNLPALCRPPQNSQWLMTYELLYGSILLRKNNHKEALDKYFAALRQSERSRNYNIQARALNGIGWVYMEMEQYAEAIKWLQKAMAVPGFKKPENSFCPVYSNLASCYGALRAFDSAHYYINQAIACSRLAEDLTSEANSLVIKANIVLTENRPAEAIILLKQTIVLRKMLNDPYYILSDLCILSNIYANTGNTDQGLEAAAEAMAIARKYNIEAKLPMIYSAFEANYAARKDYPELAGVYEEHLALKDSIYRKALAVELAEKEARYGAEKKEQEIARQKLVIQHEQDSRKVLVFCLSGFVLLIGAGSVLYVQRSKATQQRKAFRAVLDAEQKERIRIARDLHDSIGQMLSIVKMNVSNIHYQATGEEQVQTANTLNIVDQTIQELRHISHNLIPEELNFGMVSALEEMSRKINDAGTTRVQLDIAGQWDGSGWDKQFELSLYRIVQEILSNMIRHAEATVIRIGLRKKDNNVLLTVSDNGKGFDLCAIKDSKGLGWKNMTGRVKLLNGKMHIQSGKTGTQIEINIPV